MGAINIGPFEVEYDYQGKEDAWFNPAEGVGNPGCDEEITPHTVKFNGQDITGMLSLLAEQGLIADDDRWKEAAIEEVRNAMELEAERAAAEKAEYWERRSA